MGQKDLAQNNYFNDKARFADLCNGILFQGQEVIRPEELQNVEGDIVYQEGKGRRKLIPDKVRLWNGFYLALVSLENQTKVDYRMVFRMMKEEAVSYERQWNEREREYRKVGRLGKKSCLCWSGREERFVPVITLVVYYGTDKCWDGAECLYDMLDVNKALEPYITNYKLNLFDYHDCEDFSIFKTENRNLFEVLSCAKDEKKMDILLKENKIRYEELSYDAAKLICDIAGIKITLIKEIQEDGSEVVDMCKAWDDHKKAGITVGRREGIKEGIRVFVEDKIEDGVSADTIIDRLVRRFKLNEKEAGEYYRMYS